MKTAIISTLLTLAVVAVVVVDAVSLRTTSGDPTDAMLQNPQFKAIYDKFDEQIESTIRNQDVSLPSQSSPTSSAMDFQQFQQPPQQQFQQQAPVQAFVPPSAQQQPFPQFQQQFQQPQQFQQQPQQQMQLPQQLPTNDLQSTVSAPSSEPRFKATIQDVVSALNTLQVNNKEPEQVPTAQDRPTLVAFASIAHETVARATTALTLLFNYYNQLTSRFKNEKEVMQKWVETQKVNSQRQMAATQAQVIRLNDEVLHLQQVYQDAVSKDRSYQTQANQLISERELQRTPPVIPVVIQAALTDQQFQETINKLSMYRKQAAQIISQSSQGITVRQKAIKDTQAWLIAANATLDKWLQDQTQKINKRLDEQQKAADLCRKRYDALIKMRDDGNTKLKQYSDALLKFDLNEKIAYLNKVSKQYSSVKTGNPYDEAKVKAYLKSVQMELDILEKKSSEVISDGKAAPPPAYWGILAGFPGASFQRSIAHLEDDFSQFVNEMNAAAPSFMKQSAGSSSSSLSSSSSSSSSSAQVPNMVPHNPENLFGNLGSFARAPEYISEMKPVSPNEIIGSPQKLSSPTSAPPAQLPAATK